MLCTDGPARLGEGDRGALARNGVRIEERRIARLEGPGATLERVVFFEGPSLAREALFFDMPSRAQSELARRIGCAFTRRGAVLAGPHEETTVPGVFVAGNILRDVQLSIVAAAEGTRAAFGINRAITREDFLRRATGEVAVEHPMPAPEESTGG